MKRMWTGLVAAAMLVAAPVASAVTIDIGDVGTVADRSGGVFGPGPGYQSVTISLNGGSGQGVAAGMFALDFDDSSTPAGDWLQFTSFCIDPDRWLTSFVNPYTVRSLSGAGLSAQVVNDLGELWALARSQVTTAATSAAFQLAVWELAYGTTNYNLSSGAFRASGSASGIGIAQGWLNTIASGNGPVAQDLGLMVDANNSRQRLLTQVSVPEPGTLGLLGLGLAGLGLRRRRQA